METGIGATLREARNRRKVDLSEVERATKIRPRYLRAMENEEWDILPGGAYTRGFIRTYAAYLGLDGERLADEYRRATAPAGVERAPRIEPVASSGRGIGPRLSGRVWIAIVSLGLVGVLIGIGLLGGGNNGSSAPRPAETATNDSGAAKPPNAASLRPGVVVRLEALAEVWVCLLDAAGEPLVDGQILAAGTEEGPFRSAGFTVAFGNGEVTMVVDGKPAEVPATSSPIGFEIEADGELVELDETERPSCT